MFTGIVSAIGTVRTAGTTIVVEANNLSGVKLGASVAIDGVCLTAVAVEANCCRFDISSETLGRTTLGLLSESDLVNVERPLAAGDELGGHIVQGHVDSTGTVRWVRPDGEGVRMAIDAHALSKYLVEKASVTVNGVSLTVANVDDDGFEVALIPHTLASTTLKELKEGSLVNLEVDVLAKYVERLLAPWRGKAGA